MLSDLMPDRRSRAVPFFDRRVMRPGDSTLVSADLYLQILPAGRPSVWARHVAFEEGPYELVDHITVFFERKVTRIKKVKLQISEIPLVRMCTLRREDRVVLAPHD